MKQSKQACAALLALEQAFSRTAKQTDELVVALTTIRESIPEVTVPQIKAEQPWYRMNQKY